METREPILSVLLIDNNEIDIFIATKVLEELGATKITIFKSVTEALFYLNSTPTCYNLILVDLYMPFKDGFDFINEFNKLDLKTPQGQIVLTSAFFSPLDIEKNRVFEIEFHSQTINIRDDCENLP